MEGVSLADWFDRPVPKNVRIGADSWLYSSFAFLHYRSRTPEGVVIGSNTGIYNGTFFDLGPEGTAQIGDFCTIVGAIFSSNGHIILGDYVFIAREVPIADKAFATPQHHDSHGSPESRDNLRACRRIGGPWRSPAVKQATGLNLSQYLRQSLAWINTQQSNRTGNDIVTINNSKGSSRLTGRDA